MDIPADIAANAAMTRQNIALSVIKKGAEADRKIADILQQSADSLPTHSLRGRNVNFSA